MGHLQLETKIIKHGHEQPVRTVLSMLDETRIRGAAIRAFGDRARTANIGSSWTWTDHETGYMFRTTLVGRDDSAEGT